jgi:hypothetical protein
MMHTEILETFLAMAEAYLYDLALVPTHPVLVSASDAPRATDFFRVEAFNKCLKAVRTCLDNVISFEPLELYSMCFPIMQGSSRCIQILYRLSTYEDPAWDRAWLRQSFDIVPYLTVIADRFSLVATVYDLRTDEPDEVDSWTKGASSLKMALPSITASLAQTSSVLSTAQAEGDSGGMYDVPMDFSVDEWMGEIFLNWEILNGIPNNIS